MNSKVDEKKLETLQVHNYMNLSLSILIAFAITIRLYSFDEGYIFLAKMLLGFSVYLLVFSKLYHSSQKYLITTMKVSIQHGLVFGGKTEIPFGSIRDILVSQSLIQRLCDAGNLCIVTEKNKYFMLRICHPHMVKELIQRQVFNKKRMSSVSKGVSQTSLKG